MTKEVAKKIVRGITDKIECNTVDIDDWAEFWGFTREEYEEFLDVAIKALEQTRWIPVSERLPEERMYCLITVEITPYGCSPSYEVQTSWFDGRNFIHNTYIDDHIVAKRSVIAWMPLPEPYKAESEE